MAKAFIEPLAGVLRVLVEDDGRYGDRFYWSASVRWLNRHEVELCAYMTPITPTIYKAIVAEMQRQGIRRVFAVNYPDGATGERKERWFEIPEPMTPAQKYYRGCDE